MTMTLASADPSSGVPGTLGAEHRERLAPAAELLRSLSDVTRLSIVQHLITGDHRVTDLVAHLGLAQSTVSMHIACLRDCGLLTSRVRGRATHYSLAEPALTRQLLGAVEAVLGATGDAVLLCPSAGVPA